MISQVSKKKHDLPSDRWEEKLVALARSREDSEAVAQRAIQLSRQLNLSPWIALGIAERLISLKDAKILDRVGRCKELQCAILDKHRSIPELRAMMPYAAHFLAVEVMELMKGEAGDIRVVIRILESILNAERKTDEDNLSLQVRLCPIEVYVAKVCKIVGIMRRTRCEVRMAQEVEAGHVTEQFAADHIRQRRRLAMEEYQMKMGNAQDDRPRFPVRRSEGEAPSRRDHWPKSG